MTPNVTAPNWLDRRAYPFASQVMPLTAGRMHYIDEGAGDPILFVHGTPTWSFEYRHLIKALAPRYRCIAPDHLGFGLSERPATFPYTPEAHAAALSEFVDRLNLDRVTLVVHDYGGPIGLPLALARPSRVTRLVLLNTWMWSFDDDADMVKKGKLAGGALGRWMYKHLNASLRLITPSAYGDRRKLTPEIHRQYLEVFRDKNARVLVLHALARALNGSSAYYQGLWQQASRLRDLPALIVWGMKDSAFKPYQLDRWRTLLPKADVVELSAAGHWPHEEEPGAVVAALQSFLARTPVTPHKSAHHEEHEGHEEFLLNTS
jgi:haloalkane dehalogenase